MHAQIETERVVNHELVMGCFLRSPLANDWSKATRCGGMRALSEQPNERQLFDETLRRCPPMRLAAEPAHG